MELGAGITVLAMAMYCNVMVYMLVAWMDGLLISSSGAHRYFMKRWRHRCKRALVQIKCSLAGHSATLSVSAAYLR